MGLFGILHSWRLVHGGIFIAENFPKQNLSRNKEFELCLLKTRLSRGKFSQMALKYAVCWMNFTNEANVMVNFN